MEFIDLKAQQVKIKDKIQSRINRVLNHGKYIMGPEVYELEENLAEYVNVKHCITCSSGTDALLIPLLAKGVGPGDAVITTPFTYIATAEVISLVGAEPVFCDIYPETFNLDPEKIPDAVERAKGLGLNPKAIIPVDLFGLPARYRLIREKCKEYNLFIIEDAAQGFGGSIRGQLAGKFGDVASTSFFPAKPLGGYGDGGAIFTNDGEFARIMKSIRVHGFGKDKYHNVRVGINGRIDTIQAAILLEKFAIFQNEIELRQSLAEYYSTNITSNVQKPYIPKDYSSSWAQYSLLAYSTEHRFEIMKSLKEKNIPSMIYYRIPLHLQKVFRYLGYEQGDFPITEKISNCIFSVPFHPYLNKNQQNKVIEIINNE